MPLSHPNTYSFIQFRDKDWTVKLTGMEFRFGTAHVTLFMVLLIKKQMNVIIKF